MKYIICTILILALVSCVNKPEYFGYSFFSGDDEKIVVNVTSRESVKEILGSPSFVSKLDGENWIYYSYEKEHVMFWEKPISAKILVISFRDDDVVNKADIYRPNGFRGNYKFDKNYTKIGNKKPNFFKQIFGNFGRVSAI